MKVTLNLTGERPMLQHNGRMSNPLSAEARAMKALTSKKRKTDEDYLAMLTTEARGAVYETTDGLLGVPSQNLWRSLYDAATAFRRGADIKRALMVADGDGDLVVPLLIPQGRAGRSGEISVESFLSVPEHVDYRPVKVGQVRTMRARPKVPAGWTCTHHFDLLEDVIDPRDLAPIIERAGRLVGLGDWRPTFGTFATDVEA